MDVVQVKVWGVMPGPQGQSLILADTERARMLPIVIGIPEALSIHLQLNDRKFARPLAHDVLLAVLHSLGARVESALISELRNGTYYARLNLIAGGERLSIDARSSDAVAVALRANAPIYVAESVMAQAASPAGEAEADEDELDLFADEDEDEEPEPADLSDLPDEDIDRFRDIMRDAGLDDRPERS